MRARGDRGLSCTEVIIVAFVALVCLTLVLPTTLRTSHGRANTTRCSNNLRQLGIAAITYADQTRFYPHVGRIGALQGAMESPDGPRVVRALVWGGFHDNPEGFICPASYDQHLPVSDPTKLNMKRWSWNGTDSGSAEISPLSSDGVTDPPLRQTDELSFGWTRRGMNGNVAGTALLAADRAVRLTGPDDPIPDAPGDVGNHVSGLNLVQADGSARWFGVGEPGADLLTSTADRAHGALGIAPVMFDERAAKGEAWRKTRSQAAEGALPWALGLLPALLLAIALEGLAWRRRQREAQSPPALLYRDPPAA